MAGVAILNTTPMPVSKKHIEREKRTAHGKITKGIGKTAIFPDFAILSQKTKP
jgi:hypothetical protein